MAVVDIIQQAKRPLFSFEVLPPLRGADMSRLFYTVDALRIFEPQYINITTHRSEYVMRGGVQTRLRRRPGTVAVAAALRHRYDITVVPHILCSGFTREETEYVLLDLQLLGIHDLLVLRGDKAPHAKQFEPEPQGNANTLELQQQISNFNAGLFVDKEPLRSPMPPFSYGVAGYPEQHSEATSTEADIAWLKRKVESGAEYVVTQMFFDNDKYFEFAERARTAGINVPIIPGIKPFSKLAQKDVLPRIFNLQLPQEMTDGIAACKSDEDAAAFGVEWGVRQCKELINRGVQGIHFYSMGVADNIRQIANEVY